MRAEIGKILEAERRPDEMLFRRRFSPENALVERNLKFNSYCELRKKTFDESYIEKRAVTVKIKLT